VLQNDGVQALAQAMPAPMPGDSKGSGSGSGSGSKPTSSGVNSTTVAPAESARAASPSEGKPKITTAGAWAVDLKRRGVSVTSMHPTLIAWIEDKFTLPQVIEALGIARDRKPEPEQIAPNYLDRILRDPPKKQEPSWWLDDAQTMAKAKEYGVTTYGKQREQLKQDILAAIASRKSAQGPIAEMLNQRSEAA